MNNQSYNPVITSQETRKRYAVLVVDMLNDFVHGKLKCARAERIIPNIKVLLEKMREKEIPIFYCKDEHLPDDSYELKLWGPHAMKGTDGAKIIDELKPTGTDSVIPKRTYSAFDGTALDRALKGAYKGKGVDGVIIAGLHTHICARHTAYDAFVRGFDVIIAEDGVEAFTEQDHRAGLDYMKTNYGASIKKVSEILRSFR